MLLDKLEDQQERDWYADAAARHGWSRNVLLNQIMNQLHHVGEPVPELEEEGLQPAGQGGLQVPFRGRAGQVEEVQHVGVAGQLLGQLGVRGGQLGGGRQYRFEVDGDDFWIKLLFFNWAGRRRPVELGRSPGSSSWN